MPIRSALRPPRLGAFASAYSINFELFSRLRGKEKSSEDSREGDISGFAVAQHLM